MALVRIICTNCNGSGSVQDGRRECVVCKGEGSIKLEVHKEKCEGGCYSR